MTPAARLGSIAAGLVLATPMAARADQFVITDVTYVHAQNTTKDSHFRVKPLAATPANWQTPVNYLGGTIYVHTEVLTKPSNARTVHWICFEGRPSYDCLVSPAYTTIIAWEIGRAHV